MSDAQHPHDVELNNPNIFVLEPASDLEPHLQRMLGLVALTPVLLSVMNSCFDLLIFFEAVLLGQRTTSLRQFLLLLGNLKNMASERSPTPLRSTTDQYRKTHQLSGFSDILKRLNLSQVMEGRFAVGMIVPDDSQPTSPSSDVSNVTMTSSADDRFTYHDVNRHPVENGSYCRYFTRKVVTGVLQLPIFRSSFCVHLSFPFPTPDFRQVSGKVGASQFSGSVRVSGSRRDGGEHREIHTCYFKSGKLRRKYLPGAY